MRKYHSLWKLFFFKFHFFFKRSKGQRMHARLSQNKGGKKKGDQQNSPFPFSPNTKDTLLTHFDFKIFMVRYDFERFKSFSFVEASWRLLPRYFKGRIEVTSPNQLSPKYHWRSIHPHTYSPTPTATHPSHQLTNTFLSAHYMPVSMLCTQVTTVNNTVFPSVCNCAGGRRD